MVLEGGVQRNFVVLERGIYYIHQPLGETRLQFFDFATSGVRQKPANSCYLNPVFRPIDPQHPDFERC